MPQQPDQQPLSPASEEIATGQESRILCSDQILNGRREVLIRHGTDVYRLRLTRQGKLILQK
ncbi:MAG: hemin uptake protein HemP [Planctomycetaceae bacterium]